MSDRETGVCDTSAITYNRLNLNSLVTQKSYYNLKLVPKLPKLGLNLLLLISMKQN